MARHTLSTHVLDQAQGKPAAGLQVKLYRDETLLVTTTTNTDGRTDAPLLTGDVFTPGAYRIEFAVGDYFTNSGNVDANKFLGIVPIVFHVDEPSRGYHVPLLVTPWSYSTYRGS